MSCKCGSARVLSVSGKTSDMCYVYFEDEGGNQFDRSDYVPHGLNIGGGDYLEFKVCADCGTIQGEFPLSNSTIEVALKG